MNSTLLSKAGRHVGGFFVLATVTFSIHTVKATLSSSSELPCQNIPGCEGISVWAAEVCAY